jgi:hypothetical protein
MKQILKDSDNELVITIRSPLIAWTGCLGIVFLVYLAYLLFTPGHSGDKRIIGLVGATATCALTFLAFYEKSMFTFDLRSRILTWSRQRGFAKHGGTLPLTAIDRVVLQSCMGNDRYYPSHRVVLVTRNGELPMMIAYEHDDMNDVIAERIRSFLALSSNTLLEDSVRTLVECGQDVDAIRLLCEKTGITLTDAHNHIARIKDGLVSKNRDHK